MKWEKLGLIFCPNNQHEWMISHAANAVAEPLEGDLYRIYFSCRDAQNRSSIGYVVIDLTEPSKVLQISNQPVLSSGELGTFDDSGASMGCLVTVEDQRYLYYLGWNLGVTVPWRNSIGLAISPTSAMAFERFSKAPLLDRHAVDPFSISYPWVMKDGDLWRMWYGSNLKWGTEQTDMAHLLKYAESTDGIHWHREGRIAIPFQSDDEYAMSKPCVIKEPGLYRMWYSYRGKSYRIGYAESEDGVNWVRLDDQVGITVSDSGWDSETIEYPNVFDHKGDRYMVYNGNAYGKTGMGLAVLASNT